MTAITPSTSVAVYESDYVPAQPIVIPSGKKLAASTHNAETFNVFGFGGDY